MTRSYPKFVEFANSLPVSLSAFARHANITAATAWRIYWGKSAPRLQVAQKIVKASAGKLTLSDFGFEE